MLLFLVCLILELTSNTHGYERTQGHLRWIDNKTYKLDGAKINTNQKQHLEMPPNPIPQTQLKGKIWVKSGIGSKQALERML